MSEPRITLPEYRLFDYGIKCLSKGDRISIEECGSGIMRIRLYDEDEDWQETYIDRDAILNLIDRLQSFIKKKNV